ncbi:MAG TPA: TRAP transporter small permease [Desulfobacteraceae bacterium]|nr:TRAP transporter small permease [Desulfobacteraceae bacterium]
MKRMMDFMDDVSRHFAIGGGWALLALSFYISIDVIGRKLFRISLQGSDELGGYVMAVVCAMGFSYALAKRAHIRLNILLPRFPSGVQAAVNLFAYTALAVFSFMMAWLGWEMFAYSFELKAIAPTPLETPLWIPQGLWTLGLAWFFVHTAVYLFAIVVFLFKGRIRELNSIFGVETVDRQVSKEIVESRVDRTGDREAESEGV